MSKQKIKVPKGMDRHHRFCKSNGGDSSASNISIVFVEEHRAWHRLFGNKSPQEIARIISERWIESKYYMIVVPRIKLKRRKS